MIRVEADGGGREVCVMRYLIERGMYRDRERQLNINYRDRTRSHFQAPAAALLALGGGGGGGAERAEGERGVCDEIFD